VINPYFGFGPCEHPQSPTLLNSRIGCEDFLELGLSKLTQATLIAQWSAEYLEKQKERFVASSREEVNGRLMTGV
jgi:hypothetical protein